MKLKLDSNGNVVIKDGHPVYIFPNGSEDAFNAADALNKIKIVNDEAKGHRIEKEEALSKLKKFEGIDDDWIENAKKAVDTVKNFDEKKFMDAKQVEIFKSEINKTWETRENENKRVWDQERDLYRTQLSKLDREVYSLLVEGSFEKSEVIKEKTSIPPAFMFGHYGKYFQAEGDEKNPDAPRRVVGYHPDGSGRIFSRKDPTRLASFDEALMEIIEADPHKNTVLTGKSGGYRSSGGLGDVVPRDQLNAMSPIQLMELGRKTGKM